MRIKLTKIGNSVGVRLPKTVLTECGFTNEAELEVRHKMIVLAPIHHPRFGWAEELENNKQNIIRGGEWQW